MPEPHWGPVVVYAVSDGDVPIGRVSVRGYWYWWTHYGIDFTDRKELLAFAKRRLDSNPKTAEHALRRLIGKYDRYNLPEVDEARLLLDRMGKGRHDGTDAPAKASTRPDAERVHKSTSDTPLPAVDFSGTEDEAIAEINRLGGRMAVNAEGPAELPGTVITTVDLSGTKIADQHLTLLRVIPHLECVNVSDTAIGDEGLAHLRGLDQLQELFAYRTKVTGSGLEHLKGSRLHTLGIGGGSLSELRLQHIAGLTGIEYLILRGPVTDECLKHLAGLDRMKDLRLTDDHPDRLKVTDARVAHIAGLVQLRELSLECLGITDAGLVHLADLTNLRRLGLTSPRIRGDGFKALSGLVQLESLGVSGSPVTDAGLAHLAALTNLKSLGFYDTNVSDSGLVHIKRLPQLEQIDLRYTNVTPAGAEVLRKALPNARLFYDPKAQN